MRDNPEFATDVGYPGQNDRWGDQSLYAIERRKRELQAPLAVIKSIQRAKLSAEDQLNYDLFKRNLDEAIDGTRFKGEYLPLTQLNGVQQGVAQIRIHAEMQKVMVDSGFKGSFEEFLNFMRKDPRFYYTDKEEFLRGYRDIAKRADPELAHLFGKLPRLPYGVIPVPSYAEESQTTAYYQPGSPATGRPGNFNANTSLLNTRPKWEMETLTLHEAVPGHHLQIALAQELTDVPEFRKHGGHTAFVEGWGLYAESLGSEMGFYKDPYMKFGHLVYEMWRAIRLVVDTGMHMKGWTRQQAIDYFLANASKNEHDVTVEVDRYIVWPGQALAYKIGQLRIRELRNYATKELGAKFDVRSFHDQVLGNGSLPLDTLEQRIKEWAKSQKAGK